MTPYLVYADLKLKAAGNPIGTSPGTGETVSMPEQNGFSTDDNPSRSGGGKAQMIADLVAAKPHELQALSARVYELIVDRVRREKERLGR